MWCTVACFIRLGKVLSSSHFAIMEICEMKHSRDDLKGGKIEKKNKKKKNQTRAAVQHGSK